MFKKNNFKLDKVMNRLLKTLLISLLVLLPISCAIGLGPAVDVVAPTVNVISPDRAGYIQQTFIVTGDAKDNIGIKYMDLQLQPMDNPTDENTLNFRLIKGHWEKQEGSSWNVYETANTQVTGSATNYKWQLEIELESTVKTGTDFIITTRVYDNYDNETKNSKDERSVTVDMDEPYVSIISPLLKSDYDTEANSVYTLRDNSVLRNLMNGEFIVSGSQKEEARLDYLVVYIDEKSSKTADPLTIESEATAVKKIMGDNLRNFETVIDLSKILGYEHDRKTLRLVTESHDIAGNVQLKVQGWFTYWNDADIPWVAGEFGGASYDEKVSVYPSCSLQGQAYDDDGIKQIIINTYKENDTVPVKTEVLNLEDEEYPTYKAWSVNAMGENCNFRVEVECVDIYGNVTAQDNKFVKYMSVTDTNPPKIILETDTSVPMIGDENGNITIYGYVTDDGGIDSLKLLKVKSGTSADTLINYYNDQYSEWKRVSPSGTKFVTSNGNKLWEIPLGEDTILNSEHKRSFTKVFNIFTDFGIDGVTEPLTTQNFIIYASDGTSSKIDSFSFAGDTEAPVVTIDKLVVKTSSGIEKESIDFNEYNEQKKSKKLQPFNKNSTDVITDKIILSGTWSDNSTNIWKDKSKKGELNLTWEGLPDSTKVTITTDNAKQTWTTNEIVPPESTTAILSMSFTDYAGNIAKVNENFFISSSNPELLNISSLKNDGSYNNQDVIPITLEFNKAVTFSGGTQAPTLTLNVPATGTKKEIAYSSGNGSTTHVFNYTPSIGEDTELLDVIAINTYGHVWKEVDGELVVKSMTIPTNDHNKLKGSRTICIDTVAPEFKSISAISSAGAYNAGKEIFMLVEFSEDVKIEDVSKIKLQLNEKVYTTSALKTGPSSVLFTYSVKSGDNYDPVKITGITISGANITDIAGNSLTKTDVPTCTGFDRISTDTVSPAKPSVVGITKDDIIYSDNGVTFTLDGIEQAASVKKYSIDGGNSWSDYVGSVKLDINGDYNITAYQQDAAGNRSENAESIHINIDSGNILNSISAGVPTGTYTTGKDIPIYLNFRKEVILDTASLSLNLSNGQTADYESGSGTTQAKFIYTVKDGDFSEGLNVTEINGTFTDAKGKLIDNYVKTIPEGKNLLNSRVIKILTQKPVVTKVEFSQTSGKDLLTVTFSTNISKGTGNITLTHDSASYKAPAVLEPSKYNLYSSADSSISNYYTLGTNGSDASCVSDLEEKYVLNYSIDTNNSDLLDILRTAKADKVEVPVNSTYVKIINQNQLQVTLENSYKLPVKGSSYSVKLDAGLIKDSQNNANRENISYSINLPGIENPVIRINKANETITNIIARTGKATVTQPLQTNVKIDCQTSGAECYYIVNNSTNAASDVNGTSPKLITAAHANPSTITEASLTTGSTRNQYSGEFAIGSINDDDRFKGFIYLIGTRASKTTGSTTIWSDASYETAYRTSLNFTNSNNSLQYEPFWVRGGDNIGNNVEANDFPFSWDTAEFDKIRAMTSYETNKWYWVSWKINKVAYVSFVNGSYGPDSATNGPDAWCWGDCGVVPYKDKYPLYPGSSLSFYSSTNWGTTTYLNQIKKCEYRDGEAVIKQKKATDSSIAITSSKTTSKATDKLGKYMVTVQYTKATGTEYAIDIVKKGDNKTVYDSLELNPSDMKSGTTYTATFYIDGAKDAGDNGVTINGYGVTISSVSIASLYSAMTISGAGWQYKNWPIRITYKRKYNLPNYEIIFINPWNENETVLTQEIENPTDSNTTISIQTRNLNSNIVQNGGFKIYGYGLEIVSVEWQK